MKKAIFIILLSLNGIIFGQLPGIQLDFNDGNIDGWKSDHPRTFQLSAADSALKITYSRTSSSEMWDNFNYTPPQLIDPSSNPVISLRVKSNVNSVLTFKPIYSNGSHDWLQKDISNDNQWHQIQYDLVNYKGTTMNKIYLYLDGGSTDIKSGIVYFDDLQIGSDKIILKIVEVKATVIDSSQVDLKWQSNFPDFVEYYKIYRGNSSGFPCDQSTLLDTTSLKSYSDKGLTVNTAYYYKVSAVDQDDVESEPSNQVKAFTAGAINPLAIKVESVNSETVGLYEIFEMVVDLLGAQHENPFDPAEVDMSAAFTSPTGKVWTIHGFYDDFENRSQWKVRFSPNETGQWSYTLKVVDLAGIAQSEPYSFDAIESSHHGWIRASEKNPHYFQCDDGTSFYGLGVYYPWQVTLSGLDLLAAAGANFWGYWNIMYDDGTIIESLNSGLGKYDQKKCGRIDQLLEWSAERNLRMMLAIWPHDLLSNTVWAHEWHQNPYKNIVDVKDFFENEQAWKYQERQYRYLIARWGCYRSLGIWEIVNEINGTDAWQAGKTTAGRDWVQKVANYFKEHDPFKHPTTASQSGGKYWKDGYAVVDIPNVHLYETGWINSFRTNPYRGSIYTYRNISAYFRRDFQKPALMGEAGYENSYGNWSFPSPEYTTWYHNALWTTWSNGNAATPLWWDFTRRDLISDDVLMQLKAFSAVATQLDYGKNPVNRTEVKATDCDAFAMVGDSLAFGWAREINGKTISEKEVTFTVPKDTSYRVQIYDTWNGKLITTITSFAGDGALKFALPTLGESTPDVAFIARVVDKASTQIDDRKDANLPLHFALHRNYPNPFNPLTTIEYELPRKTKVGLSVFDSIGRLVSTLVAAQQEAGRHKVQFDGSQLASGVYLIRLKADDYVAVQKMVLLK